MDIYEVHNGRTPLFVNRGVFSTPPGRSRMVDMFDQCFRTESVPDWSRICRGHGKPSKRRLKVPAVYAKGRRKGRIRGKRKGKGMRVGKPSSVIAPFVLGLAAGAVVVYCVRGR